MLHITEHCLRREWIVACSKNWGNEKCIQIIFGEYDEKKPHGRPRCVWQNVNEIMCGLCELNPSGSMHVQVATSCRQSNELLRCVKRLSVFSRGM